MNIISALKIHAVHGTTEATNGWKCVSIMQDNDEILLTESEAQQLYEWLGRALNGDAPR
jgi:hypothetical protein